MEAAERHTLSVLSLVPRITADLASRVSGDAGAPALLERLSRASMFTQRFAGEEPTYGFHALFAAYLRRRLELETAKEHLRELQRRAGRTLIEAGDTEAGIALLLDSECWDDARDAIAQGAADHVAAGRTVTLRRHIDALPASLAASLAYWRGLCSTDTEPDESLADMRAACDAALAHGDRTMQLAACAGAALSLVSMGRLVELDPWLDLASNHEDLLLGDLASTHEMHVTSGVLVALVYRAPWHPLCHPLAERAETLLYRTAATGPRLLLGSLVFHFLWRGQLDRVERILAHIDGLCEHRLAAPVTLMRWWNLSVLIKTLIGALDGARADLAQLQALAPEAPAIAPQRAMAELNASILALCAGDAATARAHHEQAARLLHPDNVDGRATYEIHCGFLAQVEEDAPQALRRMRAALEAARSGGMRVREHIALIGTALAAATLDDHAQALQYLNAVRTHPFHAICRFHHWIAGCVAAYAARRRGDPADAAQHLQAALRVARDYGFRYSPLLMTNRELMPDLVAFALAQGIETEVALDLARRLHLKAPPSADASWPWAVRIRTCGQFEVEVDGAPLPSARKDSRRLLELLRVLAAHGHQPVALDTLADTLWPDADGDAARNALDNALFRLRRLLGGDERVRLRQGSLCLNAERCWIDVADLERLLDDFDASGAGDRIRALHRLYRGPLLAEDTSPLVAARRAVLRQRLHRTLTMALPGLDASGDTEAASLARATLTDSL